MTPIHSPSPRFQGIDVTTHYGFKNHTSYINVRLTGNDIALSPHPRKLGDQFTLRLDSQITAQVKGKGAKGANTPAFKISPRALVPLVEKMFQGAHWNMSAGGDYVDFPALGINSVAASAGNSTGATIQFVEQVAAFSHLRSLVKVPPTTQKTIHE